MIDEGQLTELTTWLAESALAGEPELALVIGFCERAVAAGLPLARARVLIDTLDPVHEGRVFRWGYDAAVPPEQDCGRTTPIVASGTLEPSFVPDAAAAAAWRSGPFYWMRQTGESLAAPNSGGGRNRVRCAAWPACGRI